MILAQQAEAQKRELQKDSSRDSMGEESVDDENKTPPPDPVQHSAFYQKLQTLTDKISVFKNQFYQKKPRSGINYDRILKDNKVNFKNFKQMYGSRQDKGHLTESGGDYISNFDRMTHHHSVAHVPSNRRRRDDLPKDPSVSFPALQSGGGTIGHMKRSVDHHMIGNRGKNSMRAH